MKNTKIINRLIDYYLEGSELTQEEHNNVRSLKEEMQAINYTRCYVSEAEQFFCWDKKGKLSKQCESQCNVCFRYERNNKKNCT